LTDSSIVRVARLALDAREIRDHPARDRRRARFCFHGPAFALDRDDLHGLAGLLCGVCQMLRDDLFAAERDDEHGADVRMPAIRGERVVRRVHVGSELAAAGRVRKRGADRRHRSRDAFRDDRRADDGRNDEQMVADADAAVRSPVDHETPVRSRAIPPIVGGLGDPSSCSGVEAADVAAPTRSLETLWVCTCARLARCRPSRSRSSCRT
jgi:hypothetical protein